MSHPARDGIPAQHHSNLAKCDGPNLRRYNMREASDVEKVVPCHSHTETPAAGTMHHHMAHDFGAEWARELLVFGYEVVGPFQT